MRPRILAEHDAVALTLGGVLLVGASLAVRALVTPSAGGAVRAAAPAIAASAYVLIGRP
jgi:hypothetical protein